MTMSTPKMNEKYGWLFRPLGAAMRRRLEMTLGVVVTGAAVVALSTVIKPDPSRLAPAYSPTMPSDAELRSEARLRSEQPAAPKVPPDFAAAVARGDLGAMAQLYTPGMPLDGMLSIAAESGSVPVAAWLLDRGADVHEDESTVNAPVLLADDHPDVVALLFERGAKQPSLAVAAQAGAPSAVARLLATNAPVNPPDESPLAAAVSSSRATPANKRLIVERLLASGANPNHEAGDSPLGAAVRVCEPPEERSTARAECADLIEVLVKRGARTKGDALIAALMLDESSRDPILDTLLGGHLDRGATATALAQAWSPAAPTAKRLIAKGVDWSWHDGEDDAALPLLVAVQRGDRDFARTLLDAGAPANVQFKDGTCPLGEAIAGVAMGGSADFARLVELLVERGADVNRRLPDGRTPLYAAAETGDLRVLHALLDHGARVNDVVLHETALDAAERNDRTPAARVLHARGGRSAQPPGGSGWGSGFGDSR